MEVLEERDKLKGKVSTDKTKELLDNFQKKK